MWKSHSNSSKINIESKKEPSKLMFGHFMSPLKSRNSARKTTYSLSKLKMISAKLN